MEVGFSPSTMWVLGLNSQQAWHIIAVKTKEKIFDGMYISCDNPTISFRNAKYNNEDILLIGGNTNKTGENINLKDRYDILIQTANSIFKNYNTENMNKII